MSNLNLIVHIYRKLEADLLQIVILSF